MQRFRIRNLVTKKVVVTGLLTRERARYRIDISSGSNCDWQPKWNESREKYAVEPYDVKVRNTGCMGYRGGSTGYRAQ